MGTIGCCKTFVRNYHYSLRNDPEERRKPEQNSLIKCTCLFLDAAVCPDL